MRKSTLIASLTVVLLALASGPTLFAHCQIPCGIYGDAARIDSMEEHVTTIEKSMKQIEELGKAESPNWNQLVRWVDNKESHAAELQSTVTDYFMAQRIKPVHGDEAAEAKYVKELTLLHKILVHAMKAKQSTDLSQVETLRKLIHDFEHSYMGESK